MDTAARMVEEMSEKALRVLAVAVKTIPALPEGAGIEELESGLTLLGLVGMIDPPRQEAKEAVALCRPMGRDKLLQKAREAHMPLSQHEIRTILSDMAERGLARISSSR